MTNPRLLFPILFTTAILLFFFELPKSKKKGLGLGGKRTRSLINDYALEAYHVGYRQ